MDYYSMKRKELQALCKKHKIPANSANSVLADKLSQLLNQERQIPITQQRKCFKSPVETADECEPGVSRRLAKKVRFSPTNELVEYEPRNSKTQMAMVTETRARRKSVAKKVDESVVDNINNTADLIDDGVQAPVKLTRSRVRLLENDGVVLNNGKKQGRRAVKGVEKGIDSVKDAAGNHGRVTRSKVHTLGERGAIPLDDNKQSKRSHKDSEITSEPVEKPLVARVRVTRAKVLDVNPQVQKKTGRRVAKDVKNVEPPKEITDIPVRVTRSSRQTIKEDIGSTIANPRVEKKRTRREMKATDLSDNLSNVAPEEKQEPPKRKSLRTRGIEVVDSVEDDKLEVINDSRVTRSKVPATKPSGRNTRKTVGRKQSKGQVNNHSMIKEGLDDKENVITKGKDESASANEMEAVANATRSPKSRTRSVNPIIEDQIIETEYLSPVDAYSRRSTRSGSKSRGKVVTYSLQNSVAKKHLESTIETHVSSGVIVRDGSSRKRAKLSRTKLNESEDHAEKSNTVGTPVLKLVNFDLDEKVNKTVRTPGIGGSHRRSTRSAIISRKEPSQSAIKKQPVGDAQLSSHGVKKFRHDPSVNTASGRVTRSEIKLGGNLASSFSGKLSKMKLSESDDNAEKSSTEETPVKKAVNFDLDEELTETERTPGIGGSHRRSTHSAVISDRKEPRHSTVKEKPIGDAPLSFHKVAEFKHDPPVNTAPGRVTRSGIKCGGNVTSSFSEKLSRTKPSEPEDHAEKSNTEGPVSKSVNFGLDDECIETECTPGIGGSHRWSTSSEVKSDKESSQSAIKKQPVRDSQLTSHRVTKFRHDPAVNTAPGRVTRSGIKRGGNVVCNFSERVDKKQQLCQSDHRHQPLEDAQMFSPEVAKVGPNTDVTIGVQSGTSKEVIGQLLEHAHDFSAAESVRLPTKVVEEDTVSMCGTAGVAESLHSLFSGSYSELASSTAEMELTESGSMLKGLQTDVMVDESVSVGKTVVMKESGDILIGVTAEGNNSDTDIHSHKAGSSTIHLVSFQQSDIESKSKEVEALVGSIIEDEIYAQIDKGSEQLASTCKDSLLNFVDKHEATINSEHDDQSERASTHKQVMNQAVSEDNEALDMANLGNSDEEYAGEPSRDSTMEQLTSDDELQGLAMDANDIKDDIVTAHDSLVEHGAGKELAKELQFEGVPSPGNDVHETPISGKFDSVDGCINATKECETDSKPLGGDNMPSDGVDLALSGDDGEGEAFNTNREHEANLKPLTDDDSDTAIFSKDDDFNITRLFKPTSEPSSPNDIIKPAFSGNKTLSGDLALSGDGVDLALSGDDGEGEAFNTNREHESNLKPLTDDDSDTAIFSKDDFNITRLFKPTSEPSSPNDIIEPAFSGNKTYCEFDNAIHDRKPHLKPLTCNDDVQDVNIVPNELEIGLEPLNVNIVVDVDGVMNDRSDGQDGESEHEHLTHYVTSVMDKLYVGGAGSEPAQNENMPVVTDVLLRSSDQELEPMSNVSVGKVSCDTVGVCAPVGQSVSSVSTEAPQTLAITAITVDAREESILDINKDADIFDGPGNAQVTDTKNDSLSELKLRVISEPDEGTLPKGSEIVSPDMNIEQITEETEVKTENDHVFTDKKEVTTIDHDLDSGKLIEEYSNHSVDQLGSRSLENPIGEEFSGQLMGDFVSHGCPIAKESLPITCGKEESPVGNTPPDSPTTVKEDDRYKQDETPKASTSMDWGSYNFGVKEFRNPVIVNENDLLGKGMKDGQISGLQTSARASSSMEEKFSPAVDFSSSEKKLEQGSRNVVDREFDQDVNMLKENANANMTEEIYNWPDSSLKALVTTPATTRISHPKDGQEDGVTTDSCDEDTGRKGIPALDCNQEDSGSARIFNDFSLSSLFTTPATTRITYAKDCQMENQSSEEFNGKTQVNETNCQENERNGVPNYEYFYNKYFEDEEVDGSSDKSGKHNHVEFKGDQYYLSSEMVRTDLPEASGLKDNSIRSDMPENKEA